MPSICAVRGCTQKKHLLRIPHASAGMNSFKAAKVSERSRLWLQAISREDIPLEKLKNFTVCSNHFVTGKPAFWANDQHIDWIPSINLGKISSENETNASKRLGNINETVIGIDYVNVEELDGNTTETQEIPKDPLCL